MDGSQSVLIRLPLPGVIFERLWCIRELQPVEFVREYR